MKPYLGTGAVWKFFLIIIFMNFEDVKIRLNPATEPADVRFSRLAVVPGGLQL